MSAPVPAMLYVYQSQSRLDKCSRSQNGSSESSDAGSGLGSDVTRIAGLARIRAISCRRPGARARARATATLPTTSATARASTASRSRARLYSAIGASTNVTDSHRRRRITARLRYLDIRSAGIIRRSDAAAFDVLELAIGGI